MHMLICDNAYKIDEHERITMVNSRTCISDGEICYTRYSIGHVPYAYLYNRLCIDIYR